jgi:presenilin-like A22 family membrane protease
MSRFKLKVFFTEAAFFISTQLLALLAVWQINQFPALQVSLENQRQGLTATGFILQFLIATGVFLLLIPVFKRKPVFLKLLIYIAFFVGIGTYMEIFLGQPWAFLLACLAIIISIFFNFLIVHNLLFIFSLAGISTILGLTLSPLTIVFVLVSLSLYDLVAVYLTKHMIRMAKASAGQGVFFGIIIPQKTSRLLTRTKAVKVGKKSSYYFLGGGDIALPLLLVVATAQISLWRGIIVSLFSLAGLLLMHLVFIRKARKRKPMPGLPPLVLGTLLGFLLISLF